MKISNLQNSGPDSDRTALKNARRIVVKVGTNLLTSGSTHVNKAYLNHLATAVNRLWLQGKEVTIVTSGAIGAGCSLLGFPRPPKSLPDRQACAAAGQVEIMKMYAQAFRKQRHPRPVGQMLLTRNGVEDRKRYLNARHTIEALFARGAVPIVNENDTVSVDEIRFGDNDTLSALVAVLAEAEVLIILTDVPGLMTAPPNPDGSLSSGAKLILTVPKITPEIEALARPTGSFLGTGGMTSKLEAARIVTRAGESMVIVNGRNPEIIEEVLKGHEVGTYFPPQGGRLAARKRWLAYSPRTKGTIQVDTGAREAMCGGHKSLLPSGIVKVSGRFTSGDLIAIAGPDGKAFAKGLSNYSSEEVTAIRGKKTSQIEKELGQLLFKEVVHRDNLVVL